MKEAGLAALTEMRNIRDTFRSKSSRLKKCSYGYYSKNVSKNEEALRELEDLQSKFDKVGQDWFDAAYDHEIDHPCFDTDEEDEFYEEESYQIKNEMSKTIKSISKKFDKFKARLDSDSKESNPDHNQKNF